MRTIQNFFWPIVVAIGALVVILGLALVPLYTDWLWFKDLGYGTVFTTILTTRIQIGLLFGFLFFAIIYGNLWYARRIAPPPSPMGIEQQLIERLGRLARRGIGLVIFLGSIVISAMVGLEAATHWQDWLKFFHSTPFGTKDPVFGLDIGFYVFKLPFLKYLYYWLFFALATATIATAMLHYADEAVEFFGNRLQFAPKVKTHLLLLIGAMFFLKAWGYRLAMYDVLFTRSDLFDGAGYTAIHAKIPALWILLVIAIVGGLLVLFNTVRRGVGYATTALVLVIAASVLVGAAYPGFVQQFEVAPNELQKEKPFISRAIAATREAYGISDVAARPFEAESTLTAQQLAVNTATTENIRLWDEGHLKDAYNQIQTIQQYYTFEDVDVDRYWLKGKNGERRYRQVWLSARELAQSALPQTSQTWVNKHLQYTHGYGFVMSPVNEVTTEGLPEFFVYDIPPKTSADIALRQMGVYFGEITEPYVFVDTSADEFDYPSGAENEITSYKADSGVGVGGFLRKLMFAARFSDVNILLNDNIKSDSRILYKRNIAERTRSLLPFLEFDQDPYLVTVDGGLYWMRDAYTMSDKYPYSYRTQVQMFGFNYIRNSVKVVVDAYSGKMDAYYIQKPIRDPIIETYRKIFPGIFKPIAEMPEELRNHIRYPESLFRVQTMVYERYHQTNPTVFYNNSDLWAIPNRGELVTSEGEAGPMDPYYVIMKLPNGQSEEFILMTPYVRAGKFNMVSWMCAKCDAGDYGRLVLYQFPKEKNIFGPQQIAARARQDTVISQQVALWNREGSQVGSGNLLVIPIENSLLYVMPVYLVSTSTKIPELKRVIMALGDKVVMEPTVNEALARLVGASVEEVAPGITTTPAAPGVQRAPQAAPRAPAMPGAAINEEVARLINRAVTQYNEAQQAQRKGDWATYGEKMRELEQTLETLRERAR